MPRPLFHLVAMSLCMQHTTSASALCCEGDSHRVELLSLDLHTHMAPVWLPSPRNVVPPLSFCSCVSRSSVRFDDNESRLSDKRHQQTESQHLPTASSVLVVQCTQTTSSTTTNSAARSLTQTDIDSSRSSCVQMSCSNDRGYRSEFPRCWTNPRTVVSRSLTSFTRSRIAELKSSTCCFVNFVSPL